MATPIKSLFPPIKKKPFLLNKQKAGAVARRRVSTEWRLHWGLRVEPTACVCFSFALSYCYLFLGICFICIIYFMQYLLWFFSIFHFITYIHIIYLCIHTLHGEPIKALDPSLSFLRLEKKDSSGKCDLCPLMLIWTFAWIVTHPMQLVLWSLSPLLMLNKVKRPITSRVIRAI